MSRLGRHATSARRYQVPPNRRGAKRRLTRALRRLEIHRNLEPFDPRVATTLGTGLETPRSDIDVVCRTGDPEAFLEHVAERYGMHRNFRVSVLILPALASVSLTISSPLGKRLEVEIYAVDEPTEAQPAVVHARAHARLLRSGGLSLAEETRHLKLAGYSTEEAFASVLELPGDPYVQLYALGACRQAEFSGKLHALRLARPLLAHGP